MQILMTASHFKLMPALCEILTHTELTRTHTPRPPIFFTFQILSTSLIGIAKDKICHIY